MLYPGTNAWYYGNLVIMADWMDDWDGVILCLLQKWKMGETISSPNIHVFNNKLIQFINKMETNENEVTK